MKEAISTRLQLDKLHYTEDGVLFCDLQGIKYRYVGWTETGYVAWITIGDLTAPTPGRQTTGSSASGEPDSLASG